MYRFALILIVGFPMITSAAPRTFSDLANMAVNLINGAIGVALILGIVIYFYGVVTSIPKTGEGDMERLRAHFVWGIIALFVMFSVWGILRLVSNTLFGGGGSGYDFGSSGSDQAECVSLEDCMIAD